MPLYIYKYKGINILKTEINNEIFIINKSVQLFKRNYPSHHIVYIFNKSLK